MQRALGDPGLARQVGERGGSLPVEDLEHVEDSRDPRRSGTAGAARLIPNGGRDLLAVRSAGRTRSAGWTRDVSFTSSCRPCQAVFGSFRFLGAEFLLYGEQAMLLTNATVIDGTGRARLAWASVRIEYGRIVEVGALGAEGPVPDGALDLGGRTLMPGLIDAHAHLSSDVFRSPGSASAWRRCTGRAPRPRELGYFILAKTARVLLAAGVTSVRDVGSYDDEAIALREAGPALCTPTDRGSCHAGGSSRPPPPAARSSPRCTARRTARRKCAGAVREQPARRRLRGVDGDRRALGARRGPEPGADDAA